MNNTGLRAADLADEFRSISSDKRMEYVPARANHLLIAADMLDDNVKLWDEFRKMDEWHSKELLAAMDENTKLRELVRDYERCTMHADCARCEYDGKTSTHCPLSPCFPDADELRELGVEVDA